MWLPHNWPFAFLSSPHLLLSFSLFRTLSIIHHTILLFHRKTICFCIESIHEFWQSYDENHKMNLLFLPHRLYTYYSYTYFSMHLSLSLSLSCAISLSFVPVAMIHSNEWHGMAWHWLHRCSYILLCRIIFFFQFWDLSCRFSVSVTAINEKKKICLRFHQDLICTLKVIIIMHKNTWNEKK